MTTSTNHDVLATAADALVALDLEGLAATYAADVLLDVNVPFWRFQLRGADAARRSWAEQVSDVPGAHVVAHRTTAMDGGMAVEIEARFDAADGEHLWREIHLLFGDELGIIEHTGYCTGVWTPAQRARQAVEAPMVTPWP